MRTLFNWLGPRVPGSRCLDLFAGSGALGLEALSRGAAHVTFVERDGIAVKELRARYDAYAKQAVPPRSRPKAAGFQSPKVWGEKD